MSAVTATTVVKVTVHYCFNIVVSHLKVITFCWLLYFQLKKI